MPWPHRWPEMGIVKRSGPRPEETLSAGRTLKALHEALLAEETAIRARDLNRLARIGADLQRLFIQLQQARPEPAEAVALAVFLQETTRLRSKNLHLLRLLHAEEAGKRRLLEREKLFLQVYRPEKDDSATRLYKKC